MLWDERLLIRRYWWHWFGRLLAQTTQETASPLTSLKHRPLTRSVRWAQHTSDIVNISTAYPYAKSCFPCVWWVETWQDQEIVLNSIMHLVNVLLNLYRYSIKRMRNFNALPMSDRVIANIILTGALKCNVRREKNFHILITRLSYQ